MAVPSSRWDYITRLLRFGMWMFVIVASNGSQQLEISDSSPQLIEPYRVGGRVLDGVLNIPVSEIILNEPRVCTLVGEGEAASVAQHGGLSEQGAGSGLAVRLHEAGLLLGLVRDTEVHA